MAVVSFLVTVTQTTDVVVQIDDAVWDEAKMAEFRDQMYQFKTLEQHAEHLAQFIVRFGNRAMIEGYGPVESRGADIRKPEGCEETGIVLVVGEEDLDMETKQL